MSPLATLKQRLPVEPLLEVTLPPPFEAVHHGKVRSLFRCPEGLLMVATDRLSAFDVILPDGIPGKGILLTQLSRWWFSQTAHLVPNHLLPQQDAALKACLQDFPDLISRSMLVQSLERLPLEAVVRGYLAGAATETYRQTGSLWGRPLPPGLQESEALPQPLFTPTTKAPVGEKDLPLTPEEARNLVGAERFSEVERLSLALYRFAHQRAAQSGLLLADTKFEFGLSPGGSLILIDEVLTPDSSRYWPADGYRPGRPQPSFDKQYVRDHLLAAGWDRQAPGPRLPPEILTRTLEKYLDAYARLTA